MYKYHVVYYEPFPCEKQFATSDWSDVLELLNKYKNIRVHIHNSIRNRNSCSYCTKD